MNFSTSRTLRSESEQDSESTYALMTHPVLHVHAAAKKFTSFFDSKNKKKLLQTGTFSHASAAPSDGRKWRAGPASGKTDDPLELQAEALNYSTSKRQEAER